MKHFHRLCTLLLVAMAGLAPAEPLADWQLGGGTGVDWLGNGNGSLDPGEAVAVNLTIVNVGAATAKNVVVTVVPDFGETGIVPLWIPSTGGEIATVAPNAQTQCVVRFRILPTRACNEPLLFRIEIQSSAGSADIPVSLGIGTDEESLAKDALPKQICADFTAVPVDESVARINEKVRPAGAVDVNADHVVDAADVQGLTILGK